MIAPFFTAVQEAPLMAENALIRLRRGDLEALTELIEEHQTRLYRFLLRLVREPATAEDLFQQTWIKVMEKIRNYDPNRDFTPWLLTVARNLALDHLRRYRPESLDEPLSSGDSMAELLPTTGEDQGAALLAGERSELLVHALHQLPVLYREVLTLRFEEDLKLEEIAVLLSIPLSTVKSRLRRGLESMRKLLAPDLQVGSHG
ncbi:MAG TPA: sigma-70 family RNA polymerase sigma factor [Candidatus Angelobacter sp.]|jgi:RNA polymerase sigma-70 factor (ECF subfamily)|nr:sigma-70 family RNA polymerase sigma factor [Candidatus Angelobacter sp.]